MSSYIHGLPPDAVIEARAFWTGLPICTVRVDELAELLPELVCDYTPELARALTDALLAGPFGEHGDPLMMAAEMGLALWVIDVPGVSGVSA